MPINNIIFDLLLASMFRLQFEVFCRLLSWCGSLFFLFSRLESLIAQHTGEGVRSPRDIRNYLGLLVWLIWLHLVLFRTSFV